MDTQHEDELEKQDETVLDVIARWLNALWVWLGHSARRTGRWMRKRARLAWVEREILVLREQRNDALLRLGESVYKTFRQDSLGRPELLAQFDQLQELDLALARKRRVKDRVAREEIA